MARKRKTKGSAARRVGYASGGIIDGLPGNDWQGARSEVRAYPGMYDDFGVDGYAEGGVVRLPDIGAPAQALIDATNARRAEAALIQDARAARSRAAQAGGDGTGSLGGGNLQDWQGNVRAADTARAVNNRPAPTFDNVSNPRGTQPAPGGGTFSAVSRDGPSASEQLRQMQVDNARWRVSQNDRLRRNPAEQAKALADLNTAEAGVINDSTDTTSTVERRAAETAAEQARIGIAKRIADTGDFTARSNAANTAASNASQAELAAAQAAQARTATEQAKREAARMLVPEPQEPAPPNAADFIGLDGKFNAEAYNSALQTLRADAEDERKMYSNVAVAIAADQAAGMTPAQIRAKAAAGGYTLNGYDLGPFVLQYTREQPTGYAAGGVVSAPVYGGTPQAPEATNIADQYASYVQQAQAAGMPVVPMAQFMAIQGQAMQNAPAPPMQGYAGGGVVSMEDNVDFGMPGAAGKMVIDTNPNAETDSIPAMVDGAHPAALKSGEFVIPTDVAMYYGTNFLNSLIEKARGGNTDAAPA